MEKVIQEELSKLKEKVILVVDDCFDSLATIEAILSEEGYENILTASSGPEAISVVNEKNPDLVLLDVMMPDMDGFEVCSLLHDKKEIPIIMVTAKTSPEDLKRGFEVGASDYIKKPFNGFELLARVQSSLSIKQSKDKVKLAKNGQIVDELIKNENSIDEFLREEIFELKKKNEELKQEISNNKQVIGALKSEQIRNKNIVENVGEGIFVQYTRGIITYVNAEAQRIIGHP